MSIAIAKRTLEMFEEAVKRDQGAAFRVALGKVLPHIGDAYRGADDGHRGHLGASVIGGECARALWYGFHWATSTKFGGRILRLFNRGHLEEGRFIALMIASGVQVYQQDANGKQFRISAYGGHFGGSGDGVAVGLPDFAPGTAALVEFKTHNDASFKKLKKNGLRESKLEHFVQMQIYMRKMGLTVGMYFAVNKNDDEIYAEIVQLDTTVADQFESRAIMIISAADAPSKISKSPGWMTCVWCDHKPVCHLRATPLRNCRTCEHSVAREDGQWWCESKERTRKMIFGPSPGVSDAGETLALSNARQATGCTMYELNHNFVLK